MDVNLVIGAASFPDQAITFETLIEHAMKDAAQKGTNQSEQEVILTPQNQLKIEKSGSNVYPQ